MTVAGALLGAVRFYQRAVSPNLAPRCRFEPSCSAYAAEALQVHGAARGSWLAARRLAKCAPWHRGGVDLVPPPRVAGTRGTTRTSSTAAPGRAPGAGTPVLPDPATSRVTTRVPQPGTVPAPGRTAQQEARLA